MLSALFGPLDHGILVADQQRVWVWCNPHFLHMWDIPADPATDYQQIMEALLHHVTRPAELIATITIVNDDPQTILGDVVERTDGRIVAWCSYPSQVHDHAWRIWCFRQLAEPQPGDAVVRQNDRLTALSHLVARTAHELNNPLTVVLGLAQLLLHHPLMTHPQAANMPDDLQAMIAAVMRVKHRIADLLTITREQHVPQELGASLTHPIPRAVGEPGGAIERGGAHIDAAASEPP
jgi:signal transduction histidine kinase